MNAVWLHYLAFYSTLGNFKHAQSQPDSSQGSTIATTTPQTTLPTIAASTNSSTSISSTATTTMPQTTTTSTPASSTPPSQLEVHETTLGTAICTCDLNADACDINCCCDSECTTEERKVFSSCIDAGLKEDHRYCFKRNLLAFNNTQYTTLRTDAGLLCIQYDNYKSRLLYSVPHIIRTREEFQEYKEYYAKANQAFQYAQEPEADFKYDEIYRVGDIVLGIAENGAVVNFPLPQAVFTDACSHATPVEFFVDKQTECHLAITNLTGQCVSGSTISSDWYNKRFRLLPSPKRILAPTPQPEGSRKRPGNETDDEQSEGRIRRTPPASIPVSTSTAFDVNSNKLLNITAEPTMLKISYNTATQTCQHAVFEARYTVSVNEHLVIQSATVSIGLGAVQSSMTSIRQRFSIQFKWTNQTESTFKRSGNPGYLFRKPILAGNLVGGQNDSVSAVLLDAKESNWLTLPKPDYTGLCSNVRDRVPVLFGENMLSGCLLELNLNVTTTAQCRRLQEQALTTLRGPLRDVVGVYGNASMNDPQDWIPILFENSPSEGNSAGTTSLGPGSCSNLVLGLDIEIMHALTGSAQNPQQKIVGVRYNYRGPQDVSSICVGPYCQERFPVVCSVAFIDVTEPSQASIAKIPIIDAKLPNDFFYPFTGTTFGRSTVVKSHAFIFYILTMSTYFSAILLTVT